MSASSDNLEAALRVTRSKARVNSSESLNTLDSDSGRPETPTGRLRNAKKLESIDETVATPTRRLTRAGSVQRLVIDEAAPTTPSKRNTRAGSVQRTLEENQEPALTPSKRLTRAGSVQRLDEVKASPIRRTTRRMSSESNANKDTSIIVIDDDSISENALTPRTVKRNRRISAAVTKLEEVEEEDVVIVESENEKSEPKLNKSSESVDELELRNRSISKSPIVAQRASLTSVETVPIEGANVRDEVHNIPDIVSNESSSVSPIKALKRFFMSRVSFSENETSGDSITRTETSPKAKNTALSQRKSTPRRPPQPSAEINESPTAAASSSQVDIRDDPMEEGSTAASFSNLSNIFGHFYPSYNATPSEDKRLVIDMDIDESMTTEDGTPSQALATIEPVDSAEREKIEQIEKLIGEQRDMVIEQNSSEQLVSEMMIDFAAETPGAKSPTKRKSIRASQPPAGDEIQDTEITTAKSPANRKSLNKSVNYASVAAENPVEESPTKRKSIRNSQPGGEMQDAEVPTEMSPANRKSLNKSANQEKEDAASVAQENYVESENSAPADQEEDMIYPTHVVSPKRKSLNNSVNHGKEDAAIVAQENPAVQSPIKRKSIRKSQLPCDDEMQETEAPTAKSPANRKSLYKSVNHGKEDAASVAQENSVESESSAPADQEEDMIYPTHVVSPKRKSLNKSVNYYASVAEENPVEESPTKRKSLRKRNDDMQGAEVPTEKSPAKRKSLNKTANQEKEDRKSLNKSQSQESESDGGPRTWSQSIRKSVSEGIDILKMFEKEVIKSATQRPKIISSDESEDDDEEKSEKNLFIEDEAEVGSENEDSLTPSERQYLEENELPEHGETLGSEDSELEDYEEAEEEEHEEDSFIDDDENICDEYSMDSEEEKIEKEEEKAVKTRKSRIISPSSSEDEEEQPPAPARESLSNKSKSPGKAAAVEEQAETAVEDISTKRKSRQIDESAITDVNAEPTVAESAEKRKKRKRESYLNENTLKEPKRVKTADANESEAVHMEDNSHFVANENTGEEMEEQPIVVEKSSAKKQKRDVDLGDIFQRVNQHMEEVKAQKKAQAALKKERKAMKLAKKEQLEKKVSTESDDGETKKKKKTKNKKQKHVDDVEDDDQKKADLASRLNKLQEKLELKRQRKREKKLAKMQENEKAEEEPPVASAPESVAEEKTAVVKKKSKKQKMDIENAQMEVAPQPEVENGKKKKKKVKALEVHVAPQPTASSLSLAPAESKKRKVEESDEELNEIVNVQKPSKKLKALKDDLSQHVPKKSRFEEPEQTDAAVNLNKKLKKIIPQEAARTAAPKAKKQKMPRVIPEPSVSLSRPVFVNTSAGCFLEEPVTPPYKFKSKEYKPMKSNMGRERVVQFHAKKKPAAAAVQVADFKSEILKKNKNRDKSVKNLKNLL